MRKACVGAALTCAALFGVAACGGSGSSTTATFKPEGSLPSQAPAAAASRASGAPGSNSVIMPPFGKNVHMVMTNWLPSNAGEAQAVLTDKNYELAYLYAEYTGGVNQDWTAYVSPAMQTEVQQALSQPDVTTESFTGTIRFFDMTVLQDPTVPADLDVSACFDNAQSSNTSLHTGKVIPGNQPADQHYYRYTDQLAKDSSGAWKVVAVLPPVYYPRAKECKP